MIFSLLLAYCALHSHCLRAGSCFQDVVGSRPSHVTSKQPHEYVHPATLPVDFDWRSVNDTLLVSEVTNQFLPSPCGSCWAHASTGALTDRFIIAKKGKASQVKLSPQILLDFAPGAGTCKGGSDLLAYQFIHEHAITDVTCSPNQGVDNFVWAEEPVDDMMCRTCDVEGNCKFISGTKYHISEYGSLLGESQMMAEVYARGPIACSLYAHSPAFETYSSGIIQDPTVYNFTTHVVAITGWGVSPTGMKYWVGRNSFGTAWGEEGWFMLERGVNCLNIEKTHCAWAVPQLD